MKLSKSMTEKLTILLTLKDRTPFTLRWMRFANNEHFPFKIILADGGSDDSATKIFANYSNFQDLDYKYVRYPEDINYTAYYKKVSDAMSLVESPYLLLADNDDFFCTEGLIRSIEFLEENPDYVAARGYYKGFSVKRRDSEVGPDKLELYGELKLNGLVYPLVTHNQESAADRVASHFSTWTPNWYNVARTKNLCACWNQTKALDLNDIFLMEHVLSGLLVAQGKTFSGAFPYYYRQFGEHYLTVSKVAIAREGDFFDRILSETWIKDYWLLIGALAFGIQSQDGLCEKKAREIAQLSYKRFLAAVVFGALDPYTKKTSGPPVQKIKFRKRLKNYLKFYFPGATREDRYTPRVRKFLREAIQ
jgi:glycosyltransferase domain-containing protein